MIKNNDILYKVIFDVNTDGDWTYDGIDVKEQYCKTPEIALSKIIERLKLMHNAIDCRNSDVLNELKLLILDNIEFAEYWLKKYKGIDIENYNDSFEYGNWDGEFRIEKVKIGIDEDDIITFINDEDKK